MTRRALALAIVLGVAGCAAGESAEVEVTSVEPSITSTSTKIAEPSATNTTTTTTLATSTTAQMPPSQSVDDAQRDGVILEIAELPFHRRVRAEIEVTTDEGVWILSRLSRAVEDESAATGCGMGDESGMYAVDRICTFEYGELLLVAGGVIVKAFPMPGAPPSWIHISDEHVYSGHIGDGALPDSTLVRVDRNTLEATVVLIPSSFDGGTEWLPTWHVADDSFLDPYYEAVHINSDEPGVAVASPIGNFTIDVAAVDQLIDTISSQF